MLFRVYSSSSGSSSSDSSSDSSSSSRFAALRLRRVRDRDNDLPRCDWDAFEPEIRQGRKYAVPHVEGMEVYLDGYFTFLSCLMLVFWEKNGSSWQGRKFAASHAEGLEVHLDDIFMFFNPFMFVCWEDCGSSWRLKADLDDCFTFLSCFIGGWDPCYGEILGRFWMLLRDGSWFGRHFYVLKLFCGCLGSGSGPR